MTARLPSHLTRPGIPADGFRSLGLALESGRQAYLAEQRAKLIPWAPGTLCGICYGTGKEQHERRHGGVEIVVCMPCAGTGRA